MDGDVVCKVDEERHMDGIVTKAQVGNGDAPGFFGVIGKIALGIHVRLVANDFDGTLVGADRAVAPKAPEKAAARTLGRNVEGFFLFKRRVGHIIDDAHRKVVLWRIKFQVVKDSENVAGIKFLAAHAIASAYNDRTAVTLIEGIAHIKIERFPVGARFLRAVQNGNLFHRFRKGGEEVFHGERPIKVDIEDTDFFALTSKDLHYFLSRLGTASHEDDDPFGIRRTGVIEELIVAAREFADFLHVAINHFR